MTTSLQSMLAQARSEVEEVAVLTAADAADRGALVLDAREPEEWASAHLPGAVNIPRGWLELRADPASPAADARLVANRDAPVLVYCLRSPGVRSVLATATLRQLGYRRAVAVAGGLEEWSRAGLPLETGPPDTQHTTVSTKEESP